MHYNHLTREQRYAIYLGLQEGKSRKAIARQIKVHPSTVGREIKRNSTRLGRYSWRIAQESADVRKERVPGNRGVDRNILKEALHLLKTEDWSPKQISGYLSLKSRHISHETIYKRIRSDESGELRGHCRHKLKYRRHVKIARKTKVRHIPDRTSIHDRPAEANGRRFGDWEMDLIIGKGQKSAMLTLCERSKNYLLMAKLPHGKNPEKVADTAIRLLFPYRKHVLTITTDNGSEFACHKKIAKALGTTVYLQTRMPHGKKAPLRTGTNLYANTSRKVLTCGNSRKTSSRRCSTKSTEDQEKNSISLLQKRSSSN